MNKQKGYIKYVVVFCILVATFLVGAQLLGKENGDMMQAGDGGYVGAEDAFVDDSGGNVGAAGGDIGSGGDLGPSGLDIGTAGDIGSGGDIGIAGGDIGSGVDIGSGGVDPADAGSISGGTGGNISSMSGGGIGAGSAGGCLTPPPPPLQDDRAHQYQQPGAAETQHGALHGQWLLPQVPANGGHGRLPEI